MLSKNYQLFYDECIALTRSLVIYSDLTRDTLNGLIEAQGNEVSDNPYTWLYNRHLSGQYHELDPSIRVISSDTRAEIDFTRENMVDHPITRLDYQLGGQYHKQLVAQYPQREILIRGVTDPVDIAYAVNARDFQLLSWDKALVGDNEINLIQDIQAWIDAFTRRWYKRDFAISDPLYGAAAFSVMFLHLPNAIANMRLKKVHTPEVHDWHLWTYLSGHYELDSYRNFLQRRQSLWLYRNIENIRRNAGQDRMLDQLVTHVAEPRNVKFDKLDYIRRDTGLDAPTLGDPGFTLNDYRSEQISYAVDDLWDSDRVVNETTELASLNPREQDTDKLSLQRDGQVVLDSVQPTGLLRATEDFSSSSEGDRLQMLIDSWAYLSSLGLYTFEYFVDVPNAGPIQLNAKDALIAYLYAITRANQIDLPTVPPISVKNVAPTTYPTQNELRDIAPDHYISDAQLIRVQEALVDPRAVTSLAELQQYVDEFQSQRSIQEGWYSQWMAVTARGIARDVVNAHYRYYTADLEPPGTRYHAWLESKGINIYTLDTNDWQLFADVLLEAFTGITQDQTSLSPAKRAMVEIIDRLTSYSLIITEGEGAGSRRSMEFPFLFSEGVRISSETGWRVDKGLYIVDASAEVGVTYEVPISPSIELSSDIEEGPFDVDVSLDVFTDSPVDLHYVVDLPGMFVGNIEIDMT